MYCSNCGSLLPDNAVFCKSCGTRQPDKKEPSAVEKESGVVEKESTVSIKHSNISVESSPSEKTKQQYPRKFYKFLVSPDEKIISILGQNYLQAFIAAEGFTKNIMILTEKNIYIKGKSYKGNSIQNAFSVKNDIIIPLENVTAAEFIHLSDSTAKSKTYVTVVLLIISFVFAISIYSEPLAALIAFVVFLFLLGLLIRFLFSGVTSGGKWFGINYIGGPIYVSARWYGDKELDLFSKKIISTLNNLKG